MRRKFILKFLILLGYLLILNICLNCFYLVWLQRPIFYYEYLILPLLFSLLPNKFIRTGIVFILILADTIISLSKIYFFDTFNYILKVQSLFLTNFGVIFWVEIIIALSIILILIYLLVSKTQFSNIKTKKADKQFGIAFIIIGMFLVFGLDVLFGSSTINFKPNGKSHINIAQSIFRQYVKDAKIYYKKYLPVSSIQNFNNNVSGNRNASSISYENLYNDTSKKQLLIILESWGLLKDTIKRNKQIASIEYLNEKGYSVKFDSSVFMGGTSQAEARELLNKEGQAYYSVVQNGYCDIQNLVQQKLKQGYNTIALQSFSGSYSNGVRFRKTLGFKEVKEYSFFSKFAAPNYNNHYVSVNDEAVFDYAFNVLKENKKQFVYVLTINTHLPFRVNKEENELESQYVRIHEQLEYLFKLLIINDIDKIIIVGDHSPPFIKSEERAQYSQGLVPALIIEKIRNKF